MPISQKGGGSIWDQKEIKGSGHKGVVIFLGERWDPGRIGQIRQMDKLDKWLGGTFYYSACSNNCSGV